MAVTSDNRAQGWLGSEALSPVEFEELFQAHWERVYGVLFRLLGDQGEAETVALEVFWRLYRQPPPGQARNLAGWLYRVATNLGFNALRAFKRRSQYEESAGLSVEQSFLPDPAAALEQADEREQVRAVLRQMKPRSAQLLLLRYSGLSYGEVAMALDLSPASIGTLLARAEREFEQRYRATYGDGETHASD
ncbi:MAG TPA: sigma-70 family RNA polymerase sigma factor [Ardenticatenaceae bacterium]|nr:sigma-70 family RNA polymerase sigma factor [Ardenticatenaceae bacterium]